MDRLEAMSLLIASGEAGSFSKASEVSRAAATYQSRDFGAFPNNIRRVGQAGFGQGLVCKLNSKLQVRQRMPRGAKRPPSALGIT